jgi:hypothetical protein
MSVSRQPSLPRQIVDGRRPAFENRRHFRDGDYVVLLGCLGDFRSCGGMYGGHSCVPPHQFVVCAFAQSAPCTGSFSCGESKSVTCVPVFFQLTMHSLERGVVTVLGHPSGVARSCVSISGLRKCPNTNMLTSFSGSSFSGPSLHVDSIFRIHQTGERRRLRRLSLATVI